MTCNFEFSDQNAELVAKEILNRFCSTLDHSNTDLDYEIKQGFMIKTGSPNLFFKFNTDEREPTIKSYIEFFKNTDKEEIYKEEIEWNDKVKKYILNKIDDIRNAIRSRLLQNVISELVPLQEIQIKNLEISSSVDSGFIIVIQKNMNKESYETKNDDSSVRNDIYNNVITGEMTAEEVVKMRKSQNDPRYANIVSATKKNYSSEVELSLLIDFSFTPKEEFIELIKKKNVSF